MMVVGLRIDVDTLRGTCIGVPNLVGLLARYDIRASFFFTVGPDNMGRHLWRLVRPAFLSKMLRTRAGRLYGWDIVLRGTLWQGPVIGKRCPHAIRLADQAGHEIGLHAWDHYRWQTCLERLDRHAIAADIDKGCALLSDILGRRPDCFAAPAWRVTTQALRALEKFHFRFHSDCRGHSLFRPAVGNRMFNQIQVPSTLPTFDELIGCRCTKEAYNNDLLEMIQPDRFNVLTIHAEVEGGCFLPLFKDFLEKSRTRNILFQPLGDFLQASCKPATAGISKAVVPGRPDWLSCQEPIHA